MNSREFVLRILIRFDKRPANLEYLIDRTLATSYIDHRDRRLIFEMVYGIIRRKGTLDYCIDNYLSDERYHENSLLRIILRIGFYQLLYLDRIPDHASVNETVKLAKAGEKSKIFAGTVNAVLRAFIKNKKQISIHANELTIAQRLSIEYSHPLWLIERWLAHYGLTKTKKIAVFNNTRPSIYLRRCMRHLSRQQFETDIRLLCDGATGYHDLYYRLKKNLLQENIQIVKLGWCNIQAPSSGWVVALMDIVRGEHILDLCAAPGGKSVLMAEIAGEHGTVCSCEVNYKRLEKLQETMSRMSINNIYLLSADGKKLPIHGTFDKVLIDAPCTATGVFHRHPEARWIRSEMDLKRLTTIQQELLDASTKLVECNGYLVYSTCSLEPEENENQIQQFLDRHNNFILDGCPDAIPARFIDKDGFLRITPYEHDMDGMFGARLKKIG